jgi:YidC/Oxa1 family membrane protein insertase
MNPWTLLLQGLGWLLAFFYSIIPDYGIAIILLTVLVSLLLFPLTLKQTRSMKAMQEIQPEVKRLQKELKGDREELNKQLMALYQERGVNPAAGCLPLIAQMPVWFALFRVLQVKADGDVLSPDNIMPTSEGGIGDLRRAILDGQTEFLGMDLLESPAEAIGQGIGHAAPYLILVALVIVLGYYQQYQTTRRKSGDDQSPQPQGMQTAMKILPLFLGFISWSFPGGLVLYFAVSALFRIGQQAVILRLDDRDGGDEGGVARGPAKEPEPPARPSTPKGPAPNTSKKRKQRRRK